MNVLIVMPSSLLGGAERIASNLSAHLLDKGHGVTTVTLSHGAGSLWPSLRTCERFSHLAIETTSERRGVLAFLGQLPKLARRGPFDLVYSSHVHVNAMLSVLVRLRLIRARYLVCRESTKIFDRFSGLRRWLYHIAYHLYGRQDLLIFQTEEMRASLAGSVRLPRRIRQLVIPNPVNLDGIDRAISKTQAKLDSTPFRIVYCGRLIALKRVDLLLNALALLDSNGWELAILGDGPLRADLEDKSRVLGLSGRVTFHGNVANPYAHFAQADLGVLVSEVEGFPNVLLEMMASGTKLVASTPCTEAVTALPGLTLIDPATPDAIAGMMRQAMAKRPDLAQTYRPYVEAERSMPRFFERIVQGLGASPSQKETMLQEKAHSPISP